MSARSQTRSPRLRLLGLGAGLLLGTLVTAGLLWSQMRTGDVDARVYLRSQRAQRAARQAVGQQVYQTQGRKILSDLRRDEEAALNDALAPVNRYFAQAGRGAEQFSKAVLSWDAQWALMTAKAATLLERLDRLPAWLQWRWLNRKARLLAAVLDRRAFHKYVQSQLHHHVLSQAGIEGVVQRAALQYQHRMAANDDALVNAVGRPEAAAVAKATPPSEQAAPHVETLYQATAHNTLAPSRSGAQAELIGNLIGRVGSKLLVALAAYALKVGAVELGVLSATTASTLWSFGVGLAVAALANMALRTFLDRMGKSPRRAIGRRLAAEVASLHRCVVHGCIRKMDGDTVTITGLRTWLQRHSALRAQRRARTLRLALGAG